MEKQDILNKFKELALLMSNKTRLANQLQKGVLQVRSEDDTICIVVWDSGTGRYFNGKSGIIFDLSNSEFKDLENSFKVSSSIS